MIRTNKCGFGSAMIDGTMVASKNLVAWVMGDLSDDFEAIPRMIDEINKGNADMVIGSRNIPGSSRGDQGVLKAIGSTQFSRLAKFLFRLPVYDITNAFRTFKKEIINKVKLKHNDFYISPELALKAHIAGYKLGELPVIYKDRKVGTAKTKLFSMGSKYYIRLKIRIIRGN